MYIVVLDESYPQILPNDLALYLLLFLLSMKSSFSVTDTK